MQFQVPQFIEVEDKIFGPLTFKQFVYVGGGLGACYLLWRVLPIYLAAPFIAVVGGTAAGLAFFQFNGRPFILAIESGFFFLLRSKLYLWNNARRSNHTKAQLAVKKPEEQAVYMPKLSESRLHELAWSLDIKERIAGGVANDDERHGNRAPEDLVSAIRTPQQVMRRVAETV